MHVLKDSGEASPWRLPFRLEQPHTKCCRCKCVTAQQPSCSGPLHLRAIQPAAKNRPWLSAGGRTSFSAPFPARHSKLFSSTADDTLTWQQ